eukprot:2284679-Heterocapsa_arctica.AAC.1
MAFSAPFSPRSQELGQSQKRQLRYCTRRSSSQARSWGAPRWTGPAQPYGSTERSNIAARPTPAAQPPSSTSKATARLQAAS